MHIFILMTLLAAMSSSALAEQAGDEMIPGDLFKDCADCPEMVIIPSGTYKRGWSKNPVTISHAFALSKTEVTQGQWRSVMGNNPSDSRNCGDDCPMENVSWNDAQEFIHKLNAKTGKQYRLPSEAEWEYACRAGVRQEYCGSDNLDSVGWSESNSGRSTHPVGRKQANAWGLYDMSGNVWELVEDTYSENEFGAPTDGSARQGKDDRRAARGGSWNVHPKNMTPNKSKAVKPASRDDDVGFRIARMLGAPSTEPASYAPSTVPVVALPSSNTLPTQSESAANKLRTLDKLYREGVINQKDFETKKQEILKSM